jgi:hypothetical protein
LSEFAEADLRHQPLVPMTSRTNSAVNGD